MGTTSSGDHYSTTRNKNEVTKVSADTISEARNRPHLVGATSPNGCLQKKLMSVKKTSHNWNTESGRHLLKDTDDERKN